MTGGNYDCGNCLDHDNNAKLMDDYLDSGYRQKKELVK
jgi:hypothetical protein